MVIVSKIDFTALSKFLDALDSIFSTSFEPIFWTLLASLSAPSLAVSSFTCVFDKDSSGGSGELAINGVYDSDLTTITIEILSDTNVAASTSGDFG